MWTVPRTFDPEHDDPARFDGAWVRQRIGRSERDFLAGLPDSIVLPVDGFGDVLFCHGSPKSDTEMMTSITPTSSLQRMLAGVEQSLVVCGHTHVQFDRAVDAVRVLNAGSVGVPYQGKRGAFWLALGPGAEFRRTEYDYERAAEEILRSGYWGAENLARDVILNPPDPHQVETLFERLAANRGERNKLQPES